jgi:hypothetical protein
VGNEEHKDRRTTYDWIGRIAVWAVVIAGGWFFAKRVVRTPTEHAPARVAVLIVIAGFLAFGVYRWQERRSDREGNEWDAAALDARLAWQEDHPEGKYLEGYVEPKRPDFGPNRWWLPPVIVVFVIVGFEWNLARELRGGEITDYCSYGAASEAQLHECINHVSTDYIDTLDTNAARFARAGEHVCLEDAGPYCKGRRRYIQEEEEAPGPGE